MKRRKTRLTLLGLLILLTLGFIWGNSTVGIPESRDASLSLLEWLSPVLDAVFGPGTITNHILRKAAHFTEFALLGAELRLLFLVLGQRGLQGLANALFGGLAAAVADETIQLFFDRGSQVSDVALDFSGVLAGALLITLIDFLRRKKRRRKN